MSAVAVVACVLALLLMPGHAAGAPHVIVLEPSASTMPSWPEGQRAVVAELSASGFDLVLRLSASAHGDALIAELVEAAREADALGAVAIARRGSLGVLLVVTAHSGLVRLEIPARGAIEESQAALRVADLLRSLHVPSARARAAPARPEGAARPPPASPEEKRRRRAQLWGDAGVALSSDIPGALPAFGVGASLSVWRYLGAEVSARVMPVPMRVSTSAGSLELRAVQAVGYVSVAATTRHLGLAMGLGAGVLSVDERPRAAVGFQGRRDRGSALLLSARARGFARWEPVVLSLMLEPGVTVPPITAVAENEELVRLGRPWVTVALGLGLSL